MKTILEEKIGVAEINNKNVYHGPRGGQSSAVWDLSDGRTVVITPSGDIPNWLLKKLGKNFGEFERAGGTTYQWYGWISRIKETRL